MLAMSKIELIAIMASIMRSGQSAYGSTFSFEANVEHALKLFDETVRQCAQQAHMRTRRSHVKATQTHS